MISLFTSIVPLQVRNVKKTLLSNKEVALKWDPPLYANGIIRKYEVVLQVTKRRDSR